MTFVTKQHAFVAVASIVLSCAPMHRPPSTLSKPSNNVQSDTLPKFNIPPIKFQHARLSLQIIKGSIENLPNFLYQQFKINCGKLNAQKILYMLKELEPVITNGDETATLALCNKYLDSTDSYEVLVTAMLLRDLFLSDFKREEIFVKPFLDAGAEKPEKSRFILAAMLARHGSAKGRLTLIELSVLGDEEIKKAAIEMLKTLGINIEPPKPIPPKLSKPF